MDQGGYGVGEHEVTSGWKCRGSFHNRTKSEKGHEFSSRWDHD